MLFCETWLEVLKILKRLIHGSIVINNNGYSIERCVVNPNAGMRLQASPFKRII
jgi:TPP-dependent 2-oxoacid decarboxylase